MIIAAVDGAKDEVFLLVHPLFDHVKVVLLHLAPGAGYDFPGLHDKHVLAGHATEPLGHAVVVDDVLGELDIIVALALVALQGVDVVGKLVSGEAGSGGKFDDAFFSGQSAFDFFWFIANCASIRLLFLLFAQMNHLVLFEAILVAEIFELTFVADRSQKALSSRNIFLAIKTYLKERGKIT